MGSWFVNPLLLWGGLAISVPIAIFLLTRFRYRTIEWAALTFLERALKRQQRRLRLENLLLLLIRCLLILCLVLTLARPRAASPVEVDEDDVRRNVVLLIDTSYSTGYQIGSDEEETTYEVERRTAKKIVAELEDGDRVMVLGFDETARSIYPTPRQMNPGGRQQVVQDLDDVLELRQSARGTDLGEALHALPRLLERFDFAPDGTPPPAGAKPLQKTIFVLTDAQRAGLLDGSGLLRDSSLAQVAERIEGLGGTLVLIDCGPEDPKNASIVHLASREPVVGADLPCHLEATVRNWSGQDIDNLQVEYFVDGATTPQKVVSLSVPAGEDRTPEPLRYVFDEPGTHHVSIHLKSDALLLDNQRHFVIDVRQNVQVLLVDGERSRTRWYSETDFLNEVLSLSEFAGEDGLGLMRPEVIDESQLSGRRLRDYDVIVVANVVSLDDEITASLESFARAGGSVVFTMGGLVDAESYNETMWRDGAGLFPVQLRRQRGGTKEEAERDTDAPKWVMSLSEPDHPAVSIFSDEAMEDFVKDPSIFGLYAVDMPPADEASGVSVPLTVVPGSADDAVEPDDQAGALPLLVEKPFGRGRAMVWLSSADQNWNNCVVYDGFYLPFWRELVLYLAQRARPTSNLLIGERYERLFRAEEYSATTTVSTPDGRPQGVVLRKVENEELYRLVFPPEDGELDTGDDDGEEDEDEPTAIEPALGVESPGVYTITRTGTAGSESNPRPDFFGVTIDTTEGDMSKYSAEELGEALRIEVKPMTPENASRAIQSDSGVGGGREYWRWFLAAAIALLALESLMAAFFGRRRR